MCFLVNNWRRSITRPFVVAGNKRELETQLTHGRIALRRQAESQPGAQPILSVL